MSKKKKRYALNNLIYEKGLYPYQVSEMLGYSKGVAYAWIDGRREPCAKDIIRLAEVLGTSVENMVMIVANY
jgi:plasmid maintenance system antidote protein VapI